MVNADDARLRNLLHARLMEADVSVRSTEDMHHRLDRMLAEITETLNGAKHTVEDERLLVLGVIAEEMHYDLDEPDDNIDMGFHYNVLTRLLRVQISGLPCRLVETVDHPVLAARSYIESNRALFDTMMRAQANWKAFAFLEPAGLASKRDAGMTMLFDHEGQYYGDNPKEEDLITQARDFTRELIEIFDAGRGVLEAAARSHDKITSPNQYREHVAYLWLKILKAEEVNTVVSDISDANFVEEVLLACVATLNTQHLAA